MNHYFTKFKLFQFLYLVTNFSFVSLKASLIVLLIVVAWMMAGGTNASADQDFIPDTASYSEELNRWHYVRSGNLQVTQPITHIQIEITAADEIKLSFQLHPAAQNSESLQRRFESANESVLEAVPEAPLVFSVAHAARSTTECLGRFLTIVRLLGGGLDQASYHTIIRAGESAVQKLSALHVARAQEMDEELPALSQESSSSRSMSSRSELPEITYSGGEHDVPMPASQNSSDSMDSQTLTQPVDPDGNLF